MIPALKAELRKLLTIRSTYIILLITMALNVFFSGFVGGYKLKSQELLNPHLLHNDIHAAALATAIFSALVAVLLLSHEYRYNTILYSLTANKSRSVFLLAKIIVISLFSLLLTALVMATAPLLILLGVHLAGHSLAPQSIFFGDLVWRALFHGWGHGMIGLLMAALVRNQIGALMALFIIPTTVEGLLSLLLKDNVSYLPFMALGSVMEPSKVLSYGQAAGVFLLYLVGGWLVAWYLFLKRDAN